MIKYKTHSIWASKVSAGNWRAFWRPFKISNPLTTAKYTNKLFPSRKAAYQGARDAIDYFNDEKQWEYEDNLPELSDEEFAAIFPLSEIRDGVRMYPFIINREGEKEFLKN